MCVQQGCEATYAESALARVLPDALFRQYRADNSAPPLLWWSSGCLQSCNSAFRSSSKLQDESLKMQTMLPAQSKVQLRLQNSCDDSIPTQCSALVATQGL